MEMTSVTSHQYKNDEEVVNIDTMSQHVVNTDTSNASGGEQPMILSKKALHQRDADENLFLRFLELDPPSNELASNNSNSSTAVNNNSRRLSNANTPQTGNKYIGRTPFTMTKRLTRTAERGFGFSIVWTHPPRVEKVEPGLSADRKGIFPGDYVVFVDKHNVVTMPETDVLNLIRSQGSTLTLEIFRRQAGDEGTSMVPPDLSLNTKTFGMIEKSTSISCTTTEEVLTITTTTANTPLIKSQQTNVSNNTYNNNYNNNNVNINSSNTNMRPSTVCSVGTSSSVEAAKRRLNLPQVTFSKEVGQGVDEFNYTFFYLF